MYHFVSIGSDCSPAAVLRQLGIRTCAFPFDWVQTNVFGIERCLEEDFHDFHENIRRMDHGRRMIDPYGFQYPHDYPLVGHSQENDSKIGKGLFAEDLHKPIVDNWLLYYQTVKQKYERRIQRFRDLLKGSTPIVFLSRYPEADARRLLAFLRNHYGRNDLYIVNSCPDARQDQDPSTGLYCVWTEQHGIWNQMECWRDAIQALLRFYGFDPL
jgi:hypothetical protein